MVQGHDRFHDSSDARCGFEMANLGFDGAHSDVASAFNAGPQPGKRGQFRGIADFGGRPVSFNEFNAGSVVARLAVSPRNCLDLTTLARCCDALPAPVRRSSDASDDAVNLIAVPHGIAQPLQDENTGAFAHDEPVRTGIKR